MPAGPDEITTPSEAAEHLYGVAPEEFISSRNDLVKSVRSRGDRELANEIKAMRKPSVLAAELNRLLRASPSDLDLLLEAADALARGHRSVLSGESVDVAMLQEQHRRSVARMVDPTDRHGDRIAGLLEAASLDVACRDGLRSACYVTEPVPEVGFALFADTPGERPLASVTSLDEARARRRAPETPADQASEAEEPTAAGPTTEEHTAEEPDPPDERDEEERDDAAQEYSLRAAQGRVAAAARDHEKAEESLALIYRRVEAAVKKNAKANERVVVVSQRLTNAKANLEETETALAAARSAAEAAEAALSSSADELRAARANQAEKEPSEE